jgi:hypothetical protein
VKITDVHLVSNLVRQREHLLALRKDAKITGSISVGSWSSDSLDPVMIELIRPVINAELDQRIAVIDGDLRDLGVVLE